MFPRRLIPRFGGTSSPPNLPDLKALDFFLWSFLKDNVYKTKPTTLEQLKEIIREIIATISPETCEKIMKNETERVCVASRDGHLQDIIFHTYLRSVNT